MRFAPTWMTAILILAIAGSARPAAIERMRLPTFQLTAADGRVVTTDSIVKTGRWLIVYVEPDCRRCETLLRQPLEASRLVILIGAANPDAVRATAAAFPELADAAWFADLSNASAAPLQIGAAPVVFGLNGATIEWSLPGVLAGSSEMKSVLSSWIR